MVVLSILLRYGGHHADPLGVLSETIEKTKVCVLFGSRAKTAAMHSTLNRLSVTGIVKRTTKSSINRTSKKRRFLPPGYFEC